MQFGSKCVKSLKRKVTPSPHVVEHFVHLPNLDTIHFFLWSIVSQHLSSGSFLSIFLPIFLLIFLPIFSFLSSIFSFSSFALYSKDISCISSAIFLLISVSSGTLELYIGSIITLDYHS